MLYKIISSKAMYGIVLVLPSPITKTLRSVTHNPSDLFPIATTLNDRVRP